MNSTLIKNLPIGLAIAAILLISACGKEDDGGDTVIYHKVKTRNTGTQGGGYLATIDTFSYNNDGGIDTQISIRIINGVQQTTLTYTYNYAAGVVTESRNGVLLKNYDLNAQGYYSNNGANTYDSEGHLIRSETVSGNSTEVTYTYTNGNLVNSTTLNSSGDTVYNFAYTYYTDKPDTRHFGNNFLGKGNKNLVKTQTITGTSEHYTYTYEFDSLNRITKEIMTPQAGKPFLQEYTYE